jgi:hypothetical protein
MKSFILVADTVGNPDFGQDPTRRKWGAEPLRCAVNKNNYKEVLFEWQNEYDIGMGNFVDGYILDPITEERLAHVSYGGGLSDPKYTAAGDKWMDFNKMEMTEDDIIMIPNSSVRELRKAEAQDV